MKVRMDLKTNIVKTKLHWIKSIGAELEGGGPANLEKIITKYDVKEKVSVGSDASVNVPCPLDYDCWNWVSDFEFRYWSTNPFDLELFADLLWGNGFRQNHTCGNHMHFKFNSTLALYYLSEWDFIEYYINMYRKTFEKKPKYIRRLESRYSRMYFDEYQLIENIFATGSRYHVINFISLYEDQRTLEIRIMPHAKDSNEWRRMLWFNITTIESYLNLKMGNKIIESVEIPPQESPVEQGIVV